MAEESVGANGIESRATQMGWLPQEQFRGNPDNWVPAETFVRMAEESLPHAKGTIKMMERKMEQQTRALQEQADRIAAMQSDMQEFVQVSRGAEQRAYEKAKKELLAQQQRAKDEGDMPAFVEATEKLDGLIAEHPVTTGKVSATGVEGKPLTPDDEYREWMAAEPTAYDEWKTENTWFEEDPDMFAYAQQMDQFLQTKHGFKLPRSKRLEELTKLVKKRFPDRFGNPARATGSPVEGDTGGTPSSGGGKTYNDLPPEAKKQCDKWTGADGKGEKGTISGLTRADYLSSYKW